MLPGFLLTVPAVAPFRALASDAAARYAEMAGGSAADGAALSEAVTGAVATVTADAAGEADVTIAFRPQPDGVEIDVRCGARQATVRRALVPQS